MSQKVEIMPPHTALFSLFFATLALPVLAQGLLDTHFSRKTAKHAGGCFQRDYSKAHLAEHPDQRVKSIGLAPVPLESAEGDIILNVSVFVGGDAYYSSVAYCSTKGATLACGLEGDGGAFTLTGKPDSAVLLSVSTEGMILEGQSGFFDLSADTGDDRAFLIPNVNAKYCN